MKRYEIHALSILIFLFFCLVANAGENHTGAVPQAGEEPNLFEMRSGNIKITYSTSSLNGQPLLTYKERRQTVTFQGDEIRQLDTEIGRQITVTIEQIPDLRTITFTFLLPHINFEGTEITFRTVGITTSSRTSIGGPELVNGPIQAYLSRTFWGTARRVIF